MSPSARVGGTRLTLQRLSLQTDTTAVLLDESLESDVAGYESLTFVEPVGVTSLEIGGELDSIATGTLGGINGGIEQLFTDAPSAEFGMDVHGFNLGAKTATSLEMTEHHELAHPNDLAIELSDEDITATRCLDICEGCKVWIQVGGVFFRILQRTIF